MSNMFILMIFGKMAEEDMGAIGERRNFEETSWGGGGGGGGDACGTLPWDRGKWPRKLYYTVVG